MGGDTKEPSCNGVFSRADWISAGVTALTALVIYFVTLAPSVTLEQSGAFVVAGEYLGIGRVPGYPLWHLLAKCFITIFSFVRYRGYPNPAWATNFMSAFFGALSCGFVTLLAVRMGRAVSRGGGSIAKACTAGVLGGVFFATGNTMWSQSVITETHTLTVFFVLAFLVAALVWINRPSRGSAFVLSAAFGLGLAQSHMVVLLLPPLILALLLVRPRLAVEFCLANLLLWAAPMFIFGSGYGSEPDWFFAALGLCGALVLLFALLWSSDKVTLIGAVLLTSMGLFFYAYLPLASEGGAPMQFGYPRNWAGFQHTITRGQYEKIVFSPIFSAQYLAQLWWFLLLLCRQFMFPLAVFGVLPLFSMAARRLPGMKWWAVFGLSLFMFTFLLIAGANPKGDVQDSLIQRVKFIPSFAMWSVLVGLGLLLLANGLGRMMSGKQRDDHAS